LTNTSINITTTGKTGTVAAPITPNGRRRTLTVQNNTGGDVRIAGLGSSGGIAASSAFGFKIPSGQAYTWDREYPDRAIPSTTPQGDLSYYAAATGDIWIEEN